MSARAVRPLPQDPQCPAHQRQHHRQHQQQAPRHPTDLVDVAAFGRGEIRILGPTPTALKSAMTESQILTLNERVKGFSNYFFNLSAALMAATAARVWVNGGIDLAALACLVGAIALLLLASGLLYLLEPEYEETR
jgi:hypothetical protein